MDHYFLTLINGGGPLCTIQRLKAKCDKSLTNFAVSFNLRRYNEGAPRGSSAAAGQLMSLTFRALRDDLQPARAAAVVKRLLQAGAYTRPLFSSI
jgi:hypothetical protein